MLIGLSSAHLITFKNFTNILRAEKCLFIPKNSDIKNNLKQKKKNGIGIAQFAISFRSFQSSVQLLRYLFLNKVIID